MVYSDGVTPLSSVAERPPTALENKRPAFPPAETPLAFAAAHGPDQFASPAGCRRRRRVDERLFEPRAFVAIRPPTSTCLPFRRATRYIMANGSI